MCGIAGIVGTLNPEIVSEMNNRLSHRGPDDEGVFIADKLGLAHRRLSILDLSPNGHQPMISKDGRYVLVFNGEIYNHLEIRSELENDYVFKSTSDTETLLYGFAKYGIEILQRLNGIFAFAIYDEVKKELYLVRDQFGVKPLYYYASGGELSFSSEIKSFLVLQEFNSNLDYEAFVNYLTFLWSPGENTPFEKVKKLPGGCYLKVNTEDPKNFILERYYQLPFKGKYLKDSESGLIDSLEEKLCLAVERQLLSDVPIGFFLSGGLDSSAVVALAKKVRPNHRIQCYTIGTDAKSLASEGFSDDLYYAKLLAEKLNLDLKIVDGNLEILEDFDKMIYHLDEPQGDLAPLNVYNICKQAKVDGISVLLGGVAGDDLFSGYRRHQALAYEGVISVLPKSLISVGLRILSFLGTNNATLRRTQKFFSGLNLSSKDRMANYYSWLNIDIVRGLFKKDIQALLSQYDPLGILKKSLIDISDEHNSLNQMLYWDMKFFLSDHNLNYTDKLSMATGVEVRVPFLDKDLVEFSCLIPPTLKMRGVTTKYILKKVMERYLPYEVIYRKKAGFGAPVREWVKGDLGNKLIKSMADENSIFNRLFEKSAVEKLISDNSKGAIDASFPLLVLISIDSWLNQFSRA